MKLTLCSMVAAMVIVLSSPAQAVLLKYFEVPVEDATVDSVQSSTNYGSEPTLAIQGYAEFPAIYSLGSVKQIFLKFDLSSIPDDAEIHSARFGIYFTKGNGGGASTTDPHAALYLVNDDSWEEMTITWDNMPNPVGGYVDDEVPLGDTGLYYTWNLLSDLGQNAWTNYADDLADNFITFMLVVPDEHLNNFAIFNSSEAAGNLPYLEIGYVPEPATLMILGIGGLFLVRRR